MTHTKGPWSYIGNGDVVAKSDKYCGGEKDIASVFLTVNDEDEANARLIAAAPDLLKALEELSKSFIGTYGDDPRSDNEIDLHRAFWEKKARTAIAKATGGAA